MRRHAWRWAGLAVLVALLAAGCQRKTRRTVVESHDDDIFTTDDFPGAPVQDGNVADDGRAMSPATESFISMDCVFDGDRGTAIATYVAFGEEVTSLHLFAHYYDGHAWTPAEELAAPDVDLGVPRGPGIVAFLNTTNHAGAAARERDGDAIILWQARDLAGATAADGVNYCLFATYFDVTHAWDADHRHGFQLLAVRLNTPDAANEDALEPGFLSDGLCGEARDFNSGDYHNGQDTTGIVAFWQQREDNDPLLPAPQDRSYCTSWFDVDAPGDPEVPLVPAPVVRLPLLGFGAADSGFGSEETLVGEARVYNNVLLYQVASNHRGGLPAIPAFSLPASGLTVTYGSPIPADGDDVTLQEISFDLATGTFSGPFSLASGAIDSTDTVESCMDFCRESVSADIFGSDEGLAQMLVFCCELTADADGVTDFGSGAVDGGLKVVGLDEASGTVQSQASLSSDDPAIFDSVLPNRVSIRIGRNGDYIWAAWFQADGSGVLDDLSVRAGEILTTRPADDGTFTLPLLSAATSAPLTLDVDLEGHDPDWLVFQNGLGYVCGVQSDPDVMNLFFEHADGTEDAIFQVRLTASHNPSPAPTAAVTAFESFNDGDLATGSKINNSRKGFDACDSGEGGNILAVFSQDIDSTAGTDYRLFARRTGTGAGAGKVEIDSDDPVRQAPVQFFSLVATPAGSDIGVLDPVSGDDSPDRPHPAKLVQVIFMEDRYVHGNGDSLAIRARTFDATDTGLALGEAFSPNAGASFAPPADLDLPGVDPDILTGPAEQGRAVDGTTVGFWFYELGHAYYQEFSEDGGGWRTRDGVSDPALIDDDSPVEINYFLGFYPHTCSCRNLSGAAFFWVKTFDPSSLSRRLQVRVRD